ASDTVRTDFQATPMAHAPGQHSVPPAESRKPPLPSAVTTHRATHRSAEPPPVYTPFPGHPHKASPVTPSAPATRSPSPRDSSFESFSKLFGPSTSPCDGIIRWIS